MSDPSPSSERQANGRFTKGHAGGPGRPRNPVSGAAQELDRLGVEAARELMGIILEKARQGNLKAAEMVLQRVWPARRNRPIEFEVPPGQGAPWNVFAEHSSLTDAMMNGDVTPQDAVAAVRVLQAMDEQLRGK
jgi:hypothetical protein